MHPQEVIHSINATHTNALADESVDNSFTRQGQALVCLSR